MRLASLIERLCPPLHRVLRRLNKTRRYFFNGALLAEDMPRGHYYSPLPAVEPSAAFASQQSELDTTITELPGIDLRRAAQEALVTTMLPYIKDFPWKEIATPEQRFHLAQGNFCWSDAIFLQAMLRHHRPRQVIEVGSGFSSALMLDTNDLFLDRQTRFTFIEPYPVLLQQLLRESDRANVAIHARPVQEIALNVFETLEAGDFLFIDSSHIIKTGSDVNFLLFEVLPHLKPGVIIHVHDIFWPFEYPSDWLKLGRAFNEAHALRAFLQFNAAFEILLWVPLMTRLAEPLLREQNPLLYRNRGASIWIKRTN